MFRFQGGDRPRTLLWGLDACLVVRFLFGMPGPAGSLSFEFGPEPDGLAHHEEHLAQGSSSLSQDRVRI